MKNFLLLCVAVIVTAMLSAQAPQELNYQAVVRNNSGQTLTNATPVKMRFTIHDGSASGTSVYTETINTTTNQFGLVNVQIGSTANLSTVNWGTGAKYLQVETDVNNSGTFADMGTSQLVSVPYALSALSTASGWNITGNTGTNPATNFIGTTDGQPPMFKVNNQLAGYIDYDLAKANTAFGYQTLNSITTGYANTAIGNQALYSNTSGIINTANGIQALYGNTTGTNNIATGYVALGANTSASYNIAIGSYALSSQSYNNSGTAWSSDNVAVGYNALYSNQPTSIASGIKNTAVGNYALYSNTTGLLNTAVGYQSLSSNTNGSSNTSVGMESLKNNISGYSNTATGYKALYSNSYGVSNTSIGDEALANNATGNYNIALGYRSGTEQGYNPDNTISIGNNGYLNIVSNYAMIGNLNTTWNGGNVTWVTYSDARIKKNIKDDVKGLDFINRLRPVTYYRSTKAAEEITGNVDTTNYPGKYDIEKIKFSGFLAQDVEQAAKAARYDFSGVTIPKSSKELYSLSYEVFVVPLVKAVQELAKQNEEMKKEIDELKKK